MTAFTTVDSEDLLTDLQPDIEIEIRTGVAYTAAFLDEHIPGWAYRIRHDLKMMSCEYCVLGQIFAGDHAGYTEGYSKGLAFLAELGWRDRRIVFSAHWAKPFWEQEIANRIQSGPSKTRRLFSKRVAFLT